MLLRLLIIENCYRSLAVRTMRLLQGISVQNTTKCNGRCTICPHTRVYSSCEDMSDEVWAKLLEEITSTNFQGYIAFLLQCEPLMDKKILNRIEDVKRINSKISVWLFTNASLLSTTMYKNLASSGLDSLTMSLLSATKEDYEQITGLSYELVLNNIMKTLVQSSKGTMHIAVNASLGAWSERDNYFKLFNQFTDKLKFNIRDSRAGFFDNVKSSYDDWCLKCVNTSKCFCEQPSATLPVFADGAVRLCSSDWTGESKLGNILDTPLHEIFHKVSTLQTVEKLKKGQFDYNCCKSCYTELGLGGL